MTGRTGGDLVADGGDHRAVRVGRARRWCRRSRPPGWGGRRACSRRPRTVRPSRDDRPQVVEVVLAVVAADQHLEHRLVLRHAALEPLGEEAHDLLRDRRQRLDPLGPVRERRDRRRARRPRRGRRPARWRARRRPAAGRTSGSGRCGPGRRRPGTAAGWTGPAARGGRAPSRRARSVGGGSAIQRWSSSVASATSGAERCWARKIRKTASSSCGRAVQVGHAVVGEHRGQPVAELLGQAAALDVEALQVGVEVLLGAVHPQLGVQLLARRAGCGSARRGRRTCRGARSRRRTTSTPAGRGARRARRGSRRARRRRSSGRRRSRAGSRRRPSGRARRARRADGRPRRRRQVERRAGLLGRPASSASARPRRARGAPAGRRSRPGCRSSPAAP